MKRPLRRKVRGFTLVELLVVISIIGVLAGLLLPAIQNARETSRRMSCGNNIRQLAMAATDFHSAYKKLPVSVRPLVLSNNTSDPQHRVSGLTLILPYLENGNIFSAYQLNRDWSSNYDQAGNLHSGPLNQLQPTNRQLADTRIPIFNCPSSSDPNRKDSDPQTGYDLVLNGVGVTDYSPTLGVSFRIPSGSASGSLVDFIGPGILSQNITSRLADVKDGLTNTIMYAECAGRPFLYRRNKVAGNGVLSNRVNGGGWARPASDFFIDGTTLIGTTLSANFPGLTPTAINATNGEDIGSGTFTPPTNVVSPTGFGYPASNSSPLNLTTTSPSTVLVAPSHSNGHLGTGEPYSFHVGGAHVVFGDNRIVFMDANIEMREFARMVTRESGEIIRATAE